MPDQNQSDPSNSTVTSSPQTTVDPTAQTTPPVTPIVDPTVSSSPVQQPVADVPTFFPTEDVPSVPDFQAVTTETSSAAPSPVVPTVMTPSGLPDEAVAQAGSAAPVADNPTDTPMNVFTPVISSPKKKFGGGKIIATILGLFLLVGGVGAGIVLTQQQQIVQPKAVGAGGCVCEDSKGLNTKSGDCTSSGGCNCPSGYPDVKNNKCTSSNNPGPGNGSACAAGSASVCLGKNAGDIVDSCYQALDQSLRCDGTGLNPICTADVVLTIGSCGRTPGGNGGGTGPTGTGCAPGYKAETNPDCQDHVFTECKNGQLCTTPVYDCFKTPPRLCGPTQCANTATNVVCSGTQNGTAICVDSPQCGTTSPTPTPPGATAKCENIKAYSSTWTLLTAAQLSSLAVGTHINFCVTGSTTAGTFDKARFTFNGFLDADTTAQRPGSQDFCQAYTIPAATTVFNVTAQIHHVTLGWE